MCSEFDFYLLCVHSDTVNDDDVPHVRDHGTESAINVLGEQPLIGLDQNGPDSRCFIPQKNTRHHHWKFYLQERKLPLTEPASTSTPVFSVCSS